MKLLVRVMGPVVAGLAIVAALGLVIMAVGLLGHRFPITFGLVLLGAVGFFWWKVASNAVNDDDTDRRIHDPDRADGWIWQTVDGDAASDGWWEPPPPLHRARQLGPEEVERDQTGAIKGQVRGFNSRAEGPDADVEPYNQA